MCLALPMKIKKIDGSSALGEAGGIESSVRLDFLQDIRPGDYVMVHAGFAIQKMTEQEALLNIRFLEEIKDAL